MSQTNIIELNGRRYNAITGELVAATPAHKVSHQPAAAPTAAKQRPARRGRNVDGIIHTPKALTKPVPKKSESTPKPAATPAAPVSATPHVTRKPRRPAPAAAPHRTQRSSTLHRTAVPKPALPKRTEIKPTLPAKNHHALPTVHPIERKLAAHEVEPERAKRAHKVTKSKAITRFGNAVRFAPQQPTLAPIEPVPEPTPPILAPHKDMFEHAIESATAHEQPALRKPRRFAHHRKTAGVALGAFFVLVTGGFMAYSNMPQIELRIASAQAGVHANMPAYTPAGFAKSGSIRYGNKSISISFADTTGRRHYTVTQQQSDLTGQELYDTLVAATSKSHRAIEQNGRTIYLYGDAQAAWVTGGTLYHISGDAFLNNDQLLKIASSI